MTTTIEPITDIINVIGLFNDDLSLFARLTENESNSTNYDAEELNRIEMSAWYYKFEQEESTNILAKNR